MFHETHAMVRKILEDETGLADVQLVEGGEHADLASTVSFALTKSRKRPPAEIARELAGKISMKMPPDMLTAEAQGPYINIWFGPSYVRRSIERAILPGYGSLPRKGTRVALEHTSANPNGPLHVGHIRNSIIGDTLARCFRKAGYRLEVQYYVNDMGRQIAIVVWGIDHFRADKIQDEKSDHYIARIYIAANRELEANPGIVSGIDCLMQRVESGDGETVSKFRTAVSECMDGFKITLSRLRICHDRFIWESDFVRNGDTNKFLDRIRRLDEYRDDGKVWLDLSRAGFEKGYVLRRSDGTSVYAARDLAYHVWKGRNFDRVIDVLGADHKLIGAQLQATLSLLGERQPEIVYFEFVSLPEGSMSTRAGKFVSADELMDEVTKRALIEVTERRPDLLDEQRHSIAESVAIAAIRYDIVRISPEKSTVFDWKEALNFERQSGPYIQYAHARACSILEKAGVFHEAYEFTSEREIAVAKQIAKFPHVIVTVVDELKPQHLAAYARDLADLFNAFYHFEPVLKSEGIVRESRLTLVRAVRNTLGEALTTLGINAIETM